MRRLIVNADDFGLTEGVNRAISVAHQQGIVSSSTLMATGKALNEAVALSRTLPSLSVGCHVVLVDGEPVSDPAAIPSLLDPVAAVPGILRRNASQLAAAYWRGKIRLEEVEREVAAQIQKLQSAGIEVTHVDSHQHVHMLPQIAGAIFRAAKKCGVKAARNPFEPMEVLSTSSILRRPELWSRYLRFKAMRGLYCRQFLQRSNEEGISTPQGTLGVLWTGSMNQQLFHTLVRSIPEGTWELVCHPGYRDADLNRVGTRLLDSRETELRLLTEFKDYLLQRYGVELVSYRQLV